MNDIDISKASGLSIGSLAPIINTSNIYNKQINSLELLNNNRGVLLDFFIGSW